MSTGEMIMAAQEFAAARRARWDAPGGQGQRRTSPGGQAALSHFRLGAAAQKAGRFEKAVQCYRTGLRLDPHQPLAHANLASALRALRRVAEARTAVQRALVLLPAAAELYLNLGHQLLDVSDWRRAGRAFEAARRLRSDWPDPCWNLSLVRLRHGRLAEGWDLHEARFAANNGLIAPPMPPTRWRGEPLCGRTIAIWCEQGLGDQITYASCIPDIATRAQRTLVVVEPRLVSLFQRSFPSAFVIAGDRINEEALRADLLAADFHVAAGSLPRYLRRSLADFPRHEGYLHAAPERLAEMARRLDRHGARVRVGLCWRSRLSGAARDRFYARIEDFAPLLARPDLTFVNLQYDECAVELTAAHMLSANPIIALNDLDLMHDVDGAAALTAAVDLVVSVVTSVADMAGALGRPAVILAHEDYWRMHGTAGIPWYPASRVVVRRQGETWHETIARAANVMDGLLGRAPGS
jgi:tetratricopeptide (TPR) repeat protein